MLDYPPDTSFMMGIAVFVGGTILFVLTLAATKMLAKRK